MLLAIETSGTQGALAIYNGHELVHARVLSATGMRHAQTLPAEVADAMVVSGLHPSDIRSVAVSIGPGSFTGLRVGLTFAKTFAWLNDARLVAVDTLRAIAQQVPASIEKVTSIIDAQRGEFFAATYCWDAKLRLRCAIDHVRVTTLEDLPTQYPVAGPGCRKLLNASADRFDVLEESLWQPLASSVGFIGQHMLDNLQDADIDSLEPVYIRLSYAEERRP